MFGRRADGTLVRGISTTRRFMPYLSPRRNDSLVYYTTEIDVAPALRFLEEQNRERPKERQITLFHLYLRAIAAALYERPAVNRFVAGGKLWQRRDVWITLSAKQELVDGAPVVTIKRRFDRSEGLLAMVDSLRDQLASRRGGRLSTADREVNAAIQMPGLLVRTGLALLRAADYMGLLPASMIENDPMYSSVFVANLGSVGLEAGYHHLWEYGTCSIFAVVGRIHERADGGAMMQVKYSYDERIADGMYAAITIAGVKDRLEQPQNLL